MVKDHIFLMNVSKIYSKNIGFLRFITNDLIMLITRVISIFSRFKLITTE